MARFMSYGIYFIQLKFLCKCKTIFFSVHYKVFEKIQLKFQITWIKNKKYGSVGRKFVVCVSVKLAQPKSHSNDITLHFAHTKIQQFDKNRDNFNGIIFLFSIKNVFNSNVQSAIKSGLSTRAPNQSNFITK